jgi:hypothetical protein
LPQLHAAHALPRDLIDMLMTMAERDGIGVGRAGGALSKLAGLGFIEIERASDRANLAKITAAGLRALVLRLAKR